MRSAFLTFLIVTFISVFALKAADFHCSGSEAHQDTHHEASHHDDDHENHDNGEPCKDHCPPHLHSCCTSAFVFQTQKQIELPVADQIVFSENIYIVKPEPVLEGPFQPPRLS
ncbi:MAG: hypothetical protein K0R29_407 [Pseudobdellovibrio sp.]|jgi:hypothetical protein|nr:hypothetical protein [Pseudobdellovibrio sp.]